MTNEKAMSWIYQARRIATNTNAAGNPIIIDIAMNAGQIARLISLRAKQITAGTHPLIIDLSDEDNAEMTRLGAALTGANTQSRLPSIGSAATADANVINSVGLVIPAGAKLSIYTTGASAQANDTLEVDIILELFNLSTEPTWDKSRSTDTANITIAASTISAANTITAGRVWS